MTASADLASRARHLAVHGLSSEAGELLTELADELDAAEAREGKLLGLIHDFVDSDPCWFDHHGGCQAHGYLSLKPGELCPHAEAKQLLEQHQARKTPEPSEDEKKSSDRIAATIQARQDYHQQKGLNSSAATWLDLENQMTDAEFREYQRQWRELEERTRPEPATVTFMGQPAFNPAFDHQNIAVRRAQQARGLFQ